MTRRERSSSPTRRAPRVRFAGPALLTLGLLALAACENDASRAEAAALAPAAGEQTASSGTGQAQASDEQAEAPGQVSPGDETDEGDGPGLDPAAPPTPPSFEAATRDQEEYRGVAMQALQQGDTDLAIAALITLTETPEASDLRASGALLLADLYHADGEGERAVGILERLIASSPPLAELEFVLGRTLIEMERPGDAEPHLRRAIELSPELLQSYLYLGSLLVNAGREDEAAEVYTQYEQVLRQLLAMLTTPGTPAQQRLAVVEALSLANPDQRITEALLGLLGEPNILSNAAAIRALSSVGTREAVAPLRAFAGATEHQELAMAALEAAARIEQRVD